MPLDVLRNNKDKKGGKQPKLMASDVTKMTTTKNSVSRSKTSSVVTSHCSEDQVAFYLLLTLRFYPVLDGPETS